MACLLVPGATAVVTTIMQKKFSSDLKLSWLNIMLWGGFVMLLVDHVLSGEIIFKPPFFTAGWEQMTSEALVVGLPMTLAAIIFWGVMVFVSHKLRIKKVNQERLS